MTTTTINVNCRSKPNFPLNGECLVHKTTLQHPIAVLFAMELLKGSSKHGIATIQYRAVASQKFLGGPRAKRAVLGTGVAEPLFTF